MIFTDRTITVRKGESRIDEPIVVYRGDYELEVRFTILNSRFKFMSGTNMIESEKASYGQLAILTPYGGNIFSDIVRCNDGSVTFVLTAEMLNQIEEVGLYSFQIRLMDYNKESRVSIPPIEFGIEVREPIASEDHDNSVNNAIVGYSIAKVVDPKEENVGDTFDGSGNYNKTKWETGDRISEGKLNKIEDAIDEINKNEKYNTTTLSKRIDNNFNVLDATKADVNELELEKKRIDGFLSLKEGSTTGDAELMDIRIGEDGIVYGTAGESVRKQVKQLKNELDYKVDAIDIAEIFGKDAHIMEPNVFYNGIIVAGKWSGVNDNNKHCILDINHGCEYTIIGGVSGTSSYCFLKSYNTPSENVTVTGYANGYTGARHIDINQIITEYAPDDARYLYITIKANGVDRTPYLIRENSIDSSLDYILETISRTNTILGDNSVIDLTDLIKHKYVLANGAWRSVDSYECVMIPVEAGERILMVGTGINDYYTNYAFLKNELIVDGLNAEFCDGETGTRTLNHDEEVSIEIPNGCKCLYILLKNDNTDRTPSLIRYDIRGLQQEVEEIKYTLEIFDKNINGDNSVIDLTDLIKHKYVLANGAWRSVDSYECVMIPVEAGERILMVGTGINDYYTNYAFLKNELIVDGLNAEFCDGETGTRTLNHDEEVSIEIPNGCKCLYILLKNDNTDRTPSLIRYDHKSLDERVEEACEEIYVDPSAMEQISNVMSVFGSDFFYNKGIAIKTPQIYEDRKYNAWPFINKLNDRLICFYTRAAAHEGGETRSIYCKHSFDGITWSKEIEVLTNVKAFGNVTAIGRNYNDELIFWLRDGGIGATVKHKLYKTKDGYTFEKISEVSSPSDYVIEGLTSIIQVPNVGLMSFFCTYLRGTTNVWGIITSNDNGKTWTQYPIEYNLSDYECPTEINGVYLGDGRIIAIGRRESTYGGENVLHQLESNDYGKTWTRSNTNIDDILSSTSTVMYDDVTRVISEFYVNRATNTLKLRECDIDDVWNNPKGWPNSTDIHTLKPFKGDGANHDGGQVNGVVFDGVRVVAEYAGVAGKTAIYVTLIP